MVSTNVDSHAISPVPERHFCVCWIIASVRLNAAARTQPARRKPVPNVPEKTPDKCELLHKLSD
jgi:hypothetical protein